MIKIKRQYAMFSTSFRIIYLKRKSNILTPFLDNDDMLLKILKYIRKGHYPKNKRSIRKRVFSKKDIIEKRKIKF